MVALSGFTPASAAAAPATAGPLDATHPLAMQRAAGLVATAKTGPLSPFTQAPPIAAAGHSGPHREVFGFALASSLSDPTVGYPSWDFSLLSTVAFFGLHVQTDGSFATDSGWTVWNSSDLTGLLTAAHAAGTKVVLTIILQDFSPGTPTMCAALAHASATVANTVAAVKAKGVDGVNIDYEGLNGSCGTGDPSWARHAFTAFAASMRAGLPAGSYLSVDTYASSATDSLGFFDVAGLAPSVDSFFVMAYDLEYSNAARAPTSCGTFCLGPTAPLTGYYYNDTSTAAQYTGVVPASKVILGVPYYGRKACVSAPTANQYPNPTGSVVADTYLDATGEATDPQVKPGSYVSNRDANDAAGQQRWDTWFNTTLNCTRELYWDDVTSLGHKYDLVTADNLRGVGIWNLNYGGGAPELWNELNLKFGTTTPWYSLGGGQTGTAAITWAGPRVDAFVRGSDDAVWHRFWNGTAWSAWESLGGVIEGGPYAVAQSATQIDVVVRGSDNRLWHRSSNGSSWAAWESLGGAMNADPSIVSWGPNRLDVFVRGVDNGLWHRASDSGMWGAWESLGGKLIAAPKPSSWGVGRLDVFARGTDNGLWQRTWNGTSWVQWKSVGGVVNSDPSPISTATNRIDVLVRASADNSLWQASWNGTAWTWASLGGVLISNPVATSCAAGHLDVFVISTDYAIWQRGFNGTTWAAWQRPGGAWTADPSPVCPSGANSIDLFARGADSALWQTVLTGS
ncbi:MAG: glycosyl hydrolase family 18 protein [Candidatus Dormibacterales bacterium]